MTHEPNKKNDVSQMAMFIIDVLRQDIESIPLIVNRLNSRSSLGWRFAWSHDFTETEVIEALKDLLRKGLIRPLQDNEELGKIVYLEKDADIWSNIDSLWFELTDKGREAWNKWDPPIEDENHSN